MDTTRIIEYLITILFLVTAYLIIVSPKLRPYRLRNKGIHLQASVLKINKTDMWRGDDSFAEPVYELAVEFGYKDVIYTVTKIIRLVRI
jgi:hypothetical protein